MLLQYPRNLPFSHILPLYFFFFFSLFFSMDTFPAICMRIREGCWIYTRAERGRIQRPGTYPFRDSIQGDWSWIGDPKGAYVIPPAIVRTPTSFLSEALFHALSTELAQNLRGERKRGQAHVCNVRIRIERMCTQICDHCRLHGWQFLLPFLLLFISSRFSSRFPICTSLSSGNARDREEQLFFKNKFNAREIASLSRNKLRKNILIFKRVLVESNLFATQRLTLICQYHCRQKSSDNLKFRSHCFAIIRLLRFLSRLQHPWYRRDISRFFLKQSLQHSLLLLIVRS